MRLSFGQELRMVQKQVLAPRMIQSMEILQLPIMQLQERIEQEMQENPLLEQQDEDLDLPEEEVETANPDAPTVEERELVVDETKNNEDDFERLLNMDEEWPDHFEERSKPSSTRVEEEGQRAARRHGQHGGPSPVAARLSARSVGLVRPGGPDCGRCATASFTISMPTAICKGGSRISSSPTRPPEQLALAREALALVQRLDPPGVAARDLRECLLLQLKPGVPCYEQLKTLIAGHLEDIEHNRLPVIERRTGYSIALIQKALLELRKLNPKPGAEFGEAFVPNVTPDVFVELDDNGVYRIRLEDGRTPSLYISPYYRKLLTGGTADAQTREYIKRKINSAQWLIESIEQRRNTLTRVAQAIVDHQIEFLSKGPEFIEPLKMQQIADKVGVHVTTVSRAVDDKWIQTPRGIFPLKRFFVGGTVSAGGEEVAWDTVRLKLQEIIDHENKQQPFSDDELVRELVQARFDGRPPHGDQISQGHEHSQLAATSRLVARRRKARRRSGRFRRARRRRIARRRITGIARARVRS